MNKKIWCLYRIIFWKLYHYFWNL